MTPTSRQRASSGFTQIELLVVVAIIGIAACLTAGAVQRVREAAARTRCQGNLRQIGLGLHGHSDAHLALPAGVSDPAGPFPLMSWHARILPFLEQGALWESVLAAYGKAPYFGQNPPHVGLETVLPVYGCPADWRVATPVQPAGLPAHFRVALTSYLGSEGVTQWERDGLLYVKSAHRWADVTDGTSCTLLVGERPPSANNIFGWWYAGFGQQVDGSADMVLSVRERNLFYPRACPPGPFPFGEGQLANLCDLFHFWSLHRGGSHFLFADGSVQFLRYSANELLPALASRAGGETLTAFD